MRKKGRAGDDKERQDGHISPVATLFESGLDKTVQFSEIHQLSCLDMN